MEERLGRRHFKKISQWGQLRGFPEHQRQALSGWIPTNMAIRLSVSLDRWAVRSRFYIWVSILLPSADCRTIAVQKVVAGVKESSEGLISVGLSLIILSECERFVAPSVKEGDRLGLYTQFQGLGMPSPASFFDIFNHPVCDPKSPLSTKPLLFPDILSSS
jgi:hypothetical protein